MRAVLIDRIRELRALRDKTINKHTLAMIEDLIALNTRIYYNIFGGEI